MPKPGPGEVSWHRLGYGVNAFRAGQLRLTILLASVSHTQSIFYALKLFFKWLRRIIVLVDFVTVTLEQHVRIPGERSTH